MSDTDDFETAAAAMLGAKGWTCDPAVMLPWLTDWRGHFTGAARGMASPASTREVSALVKLCARHGVAIVPQGGNSGMSGGATPDDSGDAIILSLRRMAAVRSFAPDTHTIVCDAGVILQTLHDTVEAANLRFPLTLGGKGSATIGGLISTNAGGTQVLRHGCMRDQVIGIEAVLADGSIFNALTPLKKDNRGFDLKQLLIGSEGTLGIVTAATLRLIPQIAARTVLWAGFDSIHDARALFLHVERAAGDALEGFEVIPAAALDSVIAHLPGARSPLGATHAWHALIELVADAGAAEGLSGLAEQILSEAFEAGIVDDATITTNEAQAEYFWLLRDSIAPAERAAGPAIQHDISVPVERMAQFIADVSPELERAFPGVSIIAFGHLGDGNIHFHARAPEGTIDGDWARHEGKAISSAVHDHVARWNGSLSAEHGIGQAKVDELARVGDPVSLRLMRSVKQALDPAGLLNPGKLVPLAPGETTA